MKTHRTAPTKPPSKGQVHVAVDLSEPRNLLRLGTFVTLGAVAVSLVIGASRGSLDAILVALAIAGAISLIFWMVILPVTTVMIVPEAIRLARRRMARRSPGGQKRGGVADDWLDGPP